MVNEAKCKLTVKALIDNGFSAVYCRDRQVALDYIVREAENALTIGMGGSVSLVDLNVYPTLKALGKKMLVHTKAGLSKDERMAVMQRQLTSDLFLSGTNAVTQSGSLVNMDATGNRVASMIFGPKVVIVVAGRNKIVADLDEALQRIKKHAAPTNAQYLQYQVPCAKTGICMECDAPERICRITSIIDRKPKCTDVRVLVVNEDLGF